MGRFRVSVFWLSGRNLRHLATPSALGATKVFSAEPAVIIDEAFNGPIEPFLAEWLIVLRSPKHTGMTTDASKRRSRSRSHIASMLKRLA